MMRKLPTSMALALGAALGIAPATTAQGQVEGTMDLAWIDCYLVSLTPDNFPWFGTVDFDGDAYDIVFWSVGGGLPLGQVAPESIKPFREVWAVYDGLEVAFDDECALATFEGTPIMWGLNAGRTDTETMEYAATGIVMEALGAFDGLAGSDMAMSGQIEQENGENQAAPGVLRIG